MTTETRTYSGFVREAVFGEADEIIFLSELDGPLAENLENDIANQTVSARYWVCDKECTKDEAVRDFVGQLHGIADCEFGAHYSEVTGYLWTDEGVKIGGHDLIDEIRSYVGKWVILEIDVHLSGELTS